VSEAATIEPLEELTLEEAVSDGIFCTQSGGPFHVAVTSCFGRAVQRQDVRLALAQRGILVDMYRGPHGFLSIDLVRPKIHHNSLICPFEGVGGS